MGVGDGMGVCVGVAGWDGVKVCPLASLFNGLAMLVNVLLIMGPSNFVAASTTIATNAMRKAYSTNPCPFGGFL
jgi:hypothetical protein